MTIEPPANLPDDDEYTKQAEKFAKSIDKILRKSIASVMTRLEDFEAPSTKTYTKEGANCGTGAGGFSSGNTCATGEGAADKPKGGKSKPSTTIDTSEAGKKKRAEAAKDLLEFIKEDRESERGYGTLANRRVTYAELIEKTGLSRQEFFLMLKENIGEIPDVSEGLDWEELSPVKPEEVHKLMRETLDRSHARGWNDSEHYSKEDEGLFQGAFSHYNSDSDLNISPTSSLTLASTPHPESFDRIQSNYENGESLFDARPPDTVDGIPEFNRHRDEVYGRVSSGERLNIDSLTDRSAVITESAYVSADNFFDSVKDKTYAQRGEMAMREAHAAEYFLASSGIDAEVDPFVFMGHDPYAGKSPYRVSSVADLKNPKDTQDPESAREYRKTVQAAYEDIYAMKDSHDLLSGEYGEDLANVSFRVGTRAFGDSNENQKSGRPSSSVAYYSPKKHSVNIFADGKGEEWQGDGVENTLAAGNQWTAGHKQDPILSTHVHESGHALHMAKLKKGRAPNLRDRHANMGASLDEYSPQAKKIKWEWDTTVKNDLSGYSATQPLEYVAEAFQVQKLNPKRWNKIKDKPLPNFDPDSEDKPQGYWTYQRVYDEMGGP